MWRTENIRLKKTREVETRVKTYWRKFREEVKDVEKW